MGYIGDSPFGVPAGGTGVTSITANNVLVGNGVSPITSATAGTTGQLLRGNTGSAPTFATTCPGSFAFSAASVGAAVVLTCSNTDNTNAASNSTMSVNVGGSAGGDPVHLFVIPGGQTWAQGGDNSDSDMFKVSASSALGTSDVLTMTSTGVINYPLQSCFLAYLGTSDANATGNGGTYNLGGGNALTEVFDLHGDFNTNGTYTAPNTSRVDLRSAIYVSNTTIATTFAITLTTSNRNYTAIFSRAALAADHSCFLSSICDMDAADTATVSAVVSGEVANTDTISGGSTLLTYFCGAIAA